MTGGPATEVDVLVSVHADIAGGEFRVRADVDLTTDHGPVIAFSGPSGSGKSLTLAAIAGILRPTSGTVRLGTRLVDDVTTGRHVSPQDRRVGMVFQDALLLPHRTVQDNVSLAVRHGNRTQRRDRARTELARVGAGHLAPARPRTLSGGERQRVALARALAGDPAILLLDEPLSALDLTTRQQLRRLIRDVVVERNLPTLLVSHDVDEVHTLSDSVLLFEPGATGDVHPTAQWAHRWVAPGTDLPPSSSAPAQERRR